MSLSELTPAARHARIADDFSEVAEQVADWEALTPVAGWEARDVVGHLTTWLPGLLSAGGVELDAPAPVDDDPVAAWRAHAAAVQALLDDPERASAEFSHPQIGSMPVDQAIDRFYTADVFMHTWDLARASGHDVSLDPEFCTQLLTGMEAMVDVLRDSGQYGPRVEVPADADPQTRLIGFIGRDPFWRPDTPSS